jgi:hypothetical protein
MVSRVIRMKALWSNENGSALLEGAIVVPTLFAIVLGALEFAFFFYQQHLISTGVRDAARYLARTNPSSGAAQTTARNLAATALQGGGTDRRVVGFNPDSVSIQIDFLDAPNLPDGVTGLRPYRQALPACGGPDNVRIVRVTGTMPYASLGFLGYFGLSAPIMTVTHSERCIGTS